MKYLVSVVLFAVVPCYILSVMLMPQIEMLRETYTNIDSLPGRLDPEYKQLGM